MSENKFIARLKGEPTPKSVVEIQKDRLVAPFKSSPMGHIADRDSSVVVAKGAQNWAVNQEQLVPVADDYVGTESDLTATSRVSGAGLWLNATYTFPATGDETNPVSAIIAPSAKWVLTLCGDSLITQNGSVITLTMLVKIGATHLTTKQFKVRECASQFSQRLAIDFSESEQKVIKAHGGSPLTVQVLCDDEGASATIYSGMTHLTLLQRKIDADLVSTDNVLLPEFIENLLEGYIIPADYFSRYDYIEQVEDGGSAFPQFTRSGDDMNFSGWLDISSIKNDLDELGDQVSGIEEKIPESASGSNPLITKQQLLDEEMDIRDDLSGGLSELQTQITAQAAEIATKQDQLVPGDNIVISGNTISATGAGCGTGFDAVVVQELPATGQKGIIYLVPKDGTAPDVHDEYVWIDATQTFELIGTTQVDLTDYVKNTDYATGTVGGVVKITGNHGLAVYQGMLLGSTKTLDSYNASAINLVMSKGTLENIKNDLVKRAVTENDITLTDTEKAAARTWIGAIGNTDYAGTDGSPGIIRTSVSYGTQMVTSGYIRAGVDTLESYKTRGANSFIGKGTLENIKYDLVKQGITANTIALTDDEKAAAQAWLGVSGGGGDYATVEYVDTEVAAVLDYAGDVDTRLSNANRNITQLNTNLNTVAEWVRGPKDEDGNRAELETEAQNAYAAINELNAKIGEGGGASLPILVAIWSDHLLNDVSWLRADTFSWQSGDVYVAAYEHLASELTEVQTMYGWENEKSTVVYTYSATPKAGDPVVDANGTQKDTVVSSTESVLTTTGSYSGTSQWDRYSSYDKQLDLAKTETIGDITITYYLADDGHKICLPDQESNVTALYEKTGAADYYLLDTTNKQFKLPRKQKRKLIQAVKNTNGTWYNLYSDGWIEQGGTASSGSSSVVFPVAFSGTTYYFNADLESGGTGTTLHAISSGYTTTGCTVKEGQSGVAQRALTANAKWFACGYAAESAYASVGMRLEYYYVGNFEQSAIEQTAGLNTELFNGKADVDLNNINPSNSAKATIVSYGIPDYTSSTSISGNEFVAPCAGLILFEVGATVQNGAGGSIKVNDITVDYMNTTSCTVVTRKFAWVDEDDVVVFVNGAQGNSKVFFPLKGTK